MTKKQAIKILVEHVLEMEQDDFFEECDDPTEWHPWYLAHFIKYGKGSSDLKLEWAKKNAGAT